MATHLEMMKDFLRIWQQENDWEKACRKYVADDIKIVEPTSLPQSGEYTGWNAPVTVSNIYRAVWDVELIEQNLWADEAAEMVFSRYLMKWTHKTTGRSVTMHTLEHNYFRDGKIVKMEVAHWDHAGLVATQY
jgi:hypothetical protein